MPPGCLGALRKTGASRTYQSSSLQNIAKLDGHLAAQRSSRLLLERINKTSSQHTLPEDDSRAGGIQRQINGNNASSEYLLMGSQSADSF